MLGQLIHISTSLFFLFCQSKSFNKFLFLKEGIPTKTYKYKEVYILFTRSRSRSTFQCLQSFQGQGILLIEKDGERGYN